MKEKKKDGTIRQGWIEEIHFIKYIHEKWESFPSVVYMWLPTRLISFHCVHMVTHQAPRGHLNKIEIHIAHVKGNESQNKNQSPECGKGTILIGV